MKYLTTCCFIALVLSLGPGCAKKINLPIKTSLGDLVSVEKKDKVATNKETITAKADEDIYVLSFEGKKEVDVKEAAVSDVYKLPQFPLVDSTGKDFVSVFAGSPTKDGALSSYAVTLSGDMTGMDGKFFVPSNRGKGSACRRSRLLITRARECSSRDRCLSESSATL